MDVLYPRPVPPRRPRALRGTNVFRTDAKRAEMEAKYQAELRAFQAQYGAAPPPGVSEYAHGPRFIMGSRTGKVHYFPVTDPTNLAEMSAYIGGATHRSPSPSSLRVTPGGTSVFHSARSERGGTPGDFDADSYEDEELLDGYDFSRPLSELRAQRKEREEREAAAAVAATAAAAAAAAAEDTNSRKTLSRPLSFPLPVTAPQSAMVTPRHAVRMFPNPTPPTPAEVGAGGPEGGVLLRGPETPEGVGRGDTPIAQHLLLLSPSGDEGIVSSAVAPPPLVRDIVRRSREEEKLELEREEDEEMDIEDEEERRRTIVRGVGSPSGADGDGRRRRRRKRKRGEVERVMGEEGDDETEERAKKRRKKRSSSSEGGETMATAAPVVNAEGSMIHDDDIDLLVGAPPAAAGIGVVTGIPPGARSHHHMHAHSHASSTSAPALGEVDEGLLSVSSDEFADRESFPRKRGKKTKKKPKKTVVVSSPQLQPQPPPQEEDGMQMAAESSSGSELVERSRKGKGRRKSRRSSRRSKKKKSREKKKARRRRRRKKKKKRTHGDDTDTPSSRRHLQDSMTDRELELAAAAAEEEEEGSPSSSLPKKRTKKKTKKASSPSSSQRRTSTGQSLIAAIPAFAQPSPIVEMNSRVGMDSLPVLDEISGGGGSGGGGGGDLEERNGVVGKKKRRRRKKKKKPKKSVDDVDSPVVPPPPSVDDADDMRRKRRKRKSSSSSPSSASPSPSSTLRKSASPPSSGKSSGRTRKRKKTPPPPRTPSSPPSSASSIPSPVSSGSEQSPLFQHSRPTSSGIGAGAGDADDVSGGGVLGLDVDHDAGFASDSSDGEDGLNIFRDDLILEASQTGGDGGDSQQQQQQQQRSPKTSVTSTSVGVGGSVAVGVGKGVEDEEIEDEEEHSDGSASATTAAPSLSSADMDYGLYDEGGGGDEIQFENEGGGDGGVDEDFGLSPISSAVSRQSGAAQTSPFDDMRSGGGFGDDASVNVSFSPSPPSRSRSKRRRRRRRRQSLGHYSDYFDRDGRPVRKLRKARRPKYTGLAAMDEDDGDDDFECEVELDLVSLPRRSRRSRRQHVAPARLLDGERSVDVDGKKMLAVTKDADFWRDALRERKRKFAADLEKFEKWGWKRRIEGDDRREKTKYAFIVDEQEKFVSSEVLVNRKAGFGGAGEDSGELLALGRGYVEKKLMLDFPIEQSIITLSLRSRTPVQSAGDTTYVGVVMAGKVQIFINPAGVDRDVDNSSILAKYSSFVIPMHNDYVLGQVGGEDTKVQLTALPKTTT